jgi:hypothetical protein
LAQQECHALESLGSLWRYSRTALVFVQPDTLFAGIATGFRADDFENALWAQGRRHAGIAPHYAMQAVAEIV